MMLAGISLALHPPFATLNSVRLRWQAKSLPIRAGNPKHLEHFASRRPPAVIE
jgi:hypothetical protein